MNTCLEKEKKKSFIGDFVSVTSSSAITRLHFQWSQLLTAKHLRHGIGAEMSLYKSHHPIRRRDTEWRLQVCALHYTLYFF